MAARHETTVPLRLAGLTIEGYRALQNVSWPADGLGWAKIPDIALVGGVNGSGKTTLLEGIYGILAFMLGWRPRSTIQDVAAALLPRGAVRFSVAMQYGNRPVRCTVSSRHLTEADGPDGYSVWMPPPDETESPEFAPSMSVLEAERQRMAASLRSPGSPSLLYFPTDRAVPFPAAPYKGPGSRTSGDGWIYRYTTPQDWDRSVEAILYDARWKDLNAGARGVEAGHFAAFEQSMRRFFGETKRFDWDEEGVLRVATRDGTLHSLDALSSGEKQVLLFVAELFRRWTPGSLILLDEPELHLHEAWLAALWSTLCELQRERGGQVILTTQSNYLFGLGEPGSRVLLGGGL